MASIRARILDAAARNRDRAASVRPAGLGATGNMFLSEAQTLENIATSVSAVARRLRSISEHVSASYDVALIEIANYLSGESE
jgi:hypothetical protein